MKKLVIISLLCAVLCLSVFIYWSPAEQPPIVQSQDNIRAAKGDTVWVIFNHVKPEKRADFERFHEDYFFPIIDNLTDPGEKRQMDNLRLHNPRRASSDSTFAYVYAADPMFIGGSTGFMTYLKRKYTEEEAQEHYNLFKESLARPQESYRFIETDICKNDKLVRAAEGEPTWFVLNRIKPGKEADFEHFVFDILWGVKKFEKDPTHSKTFVYTRFLKPIKPNSDGSSTYLFYMDPLIPDAHYNFRTLFEKYYTPEQVDEYLKLYGSCIQVPAKSFRATQTKR